MDDITGSFFIAVIAGVIIAFATMYLLTALSVAIGISAVPDLKKEFAKAKARDTTRGKAADGKNWNDFDHEADDTPMGVKISSAAGAFNLVTTAIALFTGASFGLTLAPEMLLAPKFAVATALVIWGLFFMLLFWLESRFASTIVGGLISVATTGLKAAAQGLGGVATGLGAALAPSPASQMKSVAESTIGELDSKFGDTFDSDRIVGAIEDFGKRMNKSASKVGNSVEQAANRVEKNVPSYDQLKDDIRKIAVDRDEAGKPQKSNPAKWTAIQSVLQSAVDSGDKSNSKDGKQKSDQIKKLMQELKAEYDEQGNAAGAVKAVAKDHAGDEQVEQYITKMQDALKKATGDSNGKGGKLDVEAVAKQFQGLVSDGKVDTNKIKERLQGMNQEDVAKLVAANTSLSKDQVNGYAEQAFKAIALVQKQLGGSGDGKSMSLSDVDTKALTEQAKKAIEKFVKANDPTGGTISKAVNNALEGDGNGGSGVPDLAALKRQLVGALTGSEDTLASVGRKLKSFDKHTVITLLTNNTSLDRSQLEGYGRTLDEAIAEVQQRVNTLGYESQAAVEKAERRAAIEAEHAREAAKSAAWWLVLCIVVSGAAAVGGALLGGL